MHPVLQGFVEDEAGTAAVNYALIVAFVAAAVFSAFAALGAGDFPNFLAQVACMISDSPGCEPTGL